MSALGFVPSSGADIEPFVKYDAKAGRWFKVDRVQTADGWATQPVDITNNATFVIDLKNIEVGWINFGNNGPEMALSKVGTPQPERPSAKHKQGFKTHLYSERNLGGKRVWSHNAKCVLNSIDALYVQYLAAPEAAQGLQPVITMVSSTPVTTKGKDANGQPVSSTNYAPVFQIVQWVADPFVVAPQQAQNTPTPAPAPAYQTPQPGPQATGAAVGPLF